MVFADQRTSSLQSATYAEQRLRAVGARNSADLGDLPMFVDGSSESVYGGVLGEGCLPNVP